MRCDLPCDVVRLDRTTPVFGFRVRFVKPRAPSYGGGAGITINFTSRERVPRLDLAMRYLRGGRADYLTDGSVRTEGSQVIREFSRSRTDQFGVYIGVVFGR